MTNLKRIAALATLTLMLGSCAGNQNKGDDDLALDEGGATATADNSAADAAAPSNAADDFADFEDTPPAQQQAAAEPAAPPAGNDELNIDDPVEAPAATPPVAIEPAPEPTPEAIPEALPEQAQVPVEAPAPVAEPAPVAASPGLATITGLKYKANDNGGTVLIEANAPITYTTRANPDLHQLIIEVPGSLLPRRLQRPLNTRDIQGSIGSIDPYQNAGSNVSRFVLQLRPGSSDPVVQQEGNTILVVASAGSKEDQVATVPLESPINVDMNDSKILESQSLTEYLSGNTKFYGKRISIETGNNMDIRDALRFIMEESGVNMVVSEEVKGSVNLKLRQVPWDQALVMILKAKQLGYTRQGNVLRISPLEQLRKEEEIVGKLVQDKQKTEPLMVRMFSLSYSQAGDLEKKAKDFLSSRGKVVGDVRTNSIVVTDIAEHVERVARLIQGLDVQPQQVLIEGKIIEAQDNFTRNVGINWGFNGQDMKLASNKNGPVNLHPSLSINPGSVIGGALTTTMTLGTFDGLGDLNATLSLYEKDEKIKIVSSPRIVAMSNEKANISQTTEVPVRQVTQNGTATQTTFVFKPLALKLEVTPQITSDGSIIMLLNVKREFAGAIDNTTGSFAVNSREATTKVLVKNGQTSVIGGIYQNDETQGETGVPYLRNIPVFGALFRGRSTERKKTELLVFLTPRILMAGETRGDTGSDVK